MSFQVRTQLVGFAILVSFLVGSARGAAPKADQALELVPVQKGVEFDRPEAEEVSECTISAQRMSGGVGWVVRSDSGVVLRQFVDTNGDNVVDQWRYYKDGLQVYRDVDSDYNGKADQYRWFHTAGTRWAVDKDEDGTLDAWKAISAEEVTAEVVAALASQDAKRFARLVLTEADLESLGVGPAKAKELANRLDGLVGRFEELARRQREVTSAAKWVQFGGNRPGIVPAGTDGSTKDLRVYENVVAVVQRGEDLGQVHVGTLVEVGDVWRVIDVPQPASDSGGELASSGFFFRSPLENPNRVVSTGPSEQAEELLSRLEKLDAASARATSVEQLSRFHAERADLLEQIAEQAGTLEERAMWVRQLADMVSAATQSGEYPGGVKRLEALLAKLNRSEKDEELVSYVRFRQLMADYGLSIQTASTEEFVKIQTDWLKGLEQYAKQYPNSPDAAEAMLQLGIAQEYAGEEDEAKRWYGRVVSEFSTSAPARKAAGARTRLDSVGKTISFKGRSPSGGTVDLAAYRGKVVLIQYWASWCEPCKAEMATLKELLTKYGRSGFSIIGVNLDSKREDMAGFLGETDVPWAQIYEEGGLDSRPANELGILTLPTMILVDQQGRVVNRSVHVVELERELKGLIR